MNWNGHLKKMRTTLQEVVHYHLDLNGEEIFFNSLLGKKLHLRFSGKMQCIQCARPIKKSFQQGYCFPCLQRLQECNLCTIYPERCLVEQGCCPQDDWAHQQCDQPHVVYLANSSDLKVGITRASQIPYRWMDQGAQQGLPIFNTRNRYQAGLIECALKKYVSDRTNWRHLLRQKSPRLDLPQERERLLALAENELQAVFKKTRSQEIILTPDAPVTEIHYPVTQYPEKTQSLSFDKQTELTGTLLGIKAQYLIFDTGSINIRKFSGYEVTVSL